MANAVWISSAPRTGSMWTFNVARALLSESGYDVLPHSVPQQDAEMMKCFHAGLADQRPESFYCLKVHSILPPDLPNSKIVTTLRDPRDICLSFMNFMKCDFDRALAAAKTVVSFVEAYQELKRDQAILLKYAEIVDHPIKVVRELDQFLALGSSDAAISKISERFSKTNVQATIEKANNDLAQKIQERQKINRSEIVVLSEQHVRAFDLGTGFQTGHISGNSDGAWRAAFSTAQQETLQNTFAEFCARFGFA